MRLRGKIWSIEEPAEGVFELVIARKANNQLLHAVFALYGSKWLEDISSLAINELIEVDFVVKGKSYTDKQGRKRWANNLIVNKLIYDREPKIVQSNLHQAFNEFENKKGV